MSTVSLFQYDSRGTNSTGVTVGDLDLYFSYKTVIAFCKAGAPRVVRANDWGPTTGHHLTSIDGGKKEAKAKRLPSAEFEAALALVLNGAPVPTSKKKGV